MRILLLFMFSIMSIKAFSSSVLWNCFKLVDMGEFASGTYSLGFSASGEMYPDINLGVQDGNSSVRIQGTITMEGAMGTWIIPCLGDVLDAHVFENALQIFAYRNLVGSGTIPMTISKGSSFYLGVQIEKLSSVWPADWNGDWSDPRIYSGEYCYGWVQLLVDETGTLSLLGSAMDLDGGAMVVGGGLAIPEPSGGVLLLLGMSVLALKRRRAEPVRIG